MWVGNGNRALRPKGQGKGTMVSVLEAGCVSQITYLRDAEIVDLVLPRYLAAQYLDHDEDGRANDWTSEKMIQHVLKSHLRSFVSRSRISWASGCLIMPPLTVVSHQMLYALTSSSRISVMGSGFAVHQTMPIPK
jgi:hypothetical protein